MWLAPMRRQSLCTLCRPGGTVPNSRRLDARPMLPLPLMIARRICIVLQTVILILSGFGGPYAALASDELSLPSRVGAVRMSIASHERIPIAGILAHPDRYQMRDLRITGTVIAIQTETIPNRMICGVAHEQTMLTLEDESGHIEVIDRGACGKNVGALKAPMLKAGQQVNLLVQMMIPPNTGTPGLSVETTIRYIEPVRE
jgi:hypothetical protein